MQLVNLSNVHGVLKIECSRCNFNCPYCMFSQRQNAFSCSTSEILDFASDSGIMRVYITGGEPTLQQELTALVKNLTSLAYPVCVKTNGSKPDIIKKMYPHVDGFVFEIKAPLQRVDQWATLLGTSQQNAEKHVQRLIESQNMAGEKLCRLWIRVMSEHINKGTLHQIVEDMKTPVQLLLHQYMSDPKIDAECKKNIGTVPSFEYLTEIAESVKGLVPSIIIKGTEGTVRMN